MAVQSHPGELGSAEQPAVKTWQPALSVVLIARGRYETIAKTVAHLSAQTARDQLELVIVVPEEGASTFAQSARADFPAVYVVALDTIRSAADARASGVRSAHAPVVVFAEDHSYPDPNWAAALISAHEGPWSAVGPVIDNGNPRGMTSWANLFLNYGPWAAPVVESRGREVEHLPGHNSSYKRAVLMSYGSRLGAMLEAESFLHWQLRAQGHRLYLDPRAKTYHVNVTRPSAFIAEHFLIGRMFGAFRARQLSLPRRVLAILTTPLTPLRRTPAILGDVFRTGRNRQLLPWILPTVLAGLAFRALGEMAGCVLGVGDAVQRLSEYEFDRMRYISTRDRMAND